MDIRAVKFRVGREWRVGGLYLPRRSSKGAVLMLHGFPGVVKNEDFAAELCRRGLTVFMPFYGGCWGSPGRFSLRGLFKDARASLKLLSRYRHVDAARVGVLGYSVGGWAALRLASETPVAAVAALAPAVPSGGAPGDPRYLRRNGRVVNMKGSREVWEEYLDESRRDRPEAYLPRIAPAPLLLVQGLKDRLVAPVATTELWKMAERPKELAELPDEDHEFQHDRATVIGRVCGWLESRLAAKLPAAVF